MSVLEGQNNLQPSLTTIRPWLSAFVFSTSGQQDLHDFLQTLFAPWGFGKDYQASDREVRAHIRRLKLRIFNGNKVHFKVSLPLIFLSPYGPQFMELL